MKMLKLAGVIFLIIICLFVIKTPILDNIETFSPFKSVPCVSSSRIYLNSVDENAIQGTGVALKSLNRDNSLNFYIEANLPIAHGSVYTNENIVYQVLNNDNYLLSLERHNDGFYKGQLTIPNSSNSFYKSLQHISIVAVIDQSTTIPVISGLF